MMAAIRIMQEVLKNFETLLLRATQEGDVDVVKIMVRDKFFAIKDTVLERALQIAVQNDDYELVETFLLRGVNTCSEDGKDNLLHIALALETNDVAKLLISHGMSVNAKNDAGETPLHIVCLQGNFEMVKLLLSKNADRRAINRDLQNPLFYSVLEEESKASILKTLLNFPDVDINAKDRDGNNLTSFTHRGQIEQADCHVLATLILHGAIIKQRDSPTCSCEVESTYENCPVVVVLAKLAALNPPLGNRLTNRLCIPLDSVDAIQLKMAEDLFAEVTYLQKIILTEKYRLFHLLHGSRNLKAKLVQNVNLDNILLTCKNSFHDPMPLLGEILDIILIKARNRKELQSQSREILPMVLGIRIPEVTEELITGHLSNLNLQCIIDVNQYLL